jgi:hypothetical protein
VEVTCGIRAFDPHELLCHALAERLGYYADEGLTVRLWDTTFTPDAALPTSAYFQVACGAAALGRQAGHPWKIVFVAVERPMFWVYGAVEKLDGSRIAGYPSGSPPDVLLREALVEPDVEILPSASDAMRIGLVRSGAVDAALLSSAVSPPSDLKQLLFLGDAIRAATTGIAVHESTLTEEPELVGALVRAHRLALTAIETSAEDVAVALTDFFGLGTERLDSIATYFTENGHADTSRDPALFDFSFIE